MTNRERVAHTPGPWTLGDENNASAEVEIGDTTCVLSRTGFRTDAYVIGRDEMLANAHLIMAAPNLLAALKALVAMYDAGTRAHCGPAVLAKLAAADAAIAKAEQR